MKRKPDHITQADWDAVDISDMGNIPFNGINTEGRTPADILAYFKSGGKGWQSRISDELSQYVAEHKKQ